MKKFIFLLFFSFLTFFVKSQTEFNFNSTNYSQFQVSGTAQCGIGNVYCIITRSAEVNGYGNYCYQIYFATNSYFYNCSPARTYIPNIEVIYLEGLIWYYPLNYSKFWMTVGQTSLAYTLFHPNPYLNIKIRTGLVEPTIY
jgi:hypothetical protein